MGTDTFSFALQNAARQQKVAGRTCLIRPVNVDLESGAENHSRAPTRQIQQTNSETFSKEPLRIDDCTTQLPKTSEVTEYDERRNGNENEGFKDRG